MNLVKIVTHHENPDLAAELFAREGVVAVGWSEFGNLRGLTYDDLKQKSKRALKSNTFGATSPDKGLLRSVFSKNA
jgi:hypothetical protein